ncbi:MAG: hypothetical protein V3W34_13605 [Phycisphaerae bacterium]
MQAARKLRTTVQPGGKIEISDPGLPVGHTVEVTIRLMEGMSGRRSVLDILAECPGGVLFKTAEQVDAYIRQERASWDP